jgi:hypothetical protein
MEAARTSETSVDNHFTRQYNPEDSSEHHTRRRENLKSHIRKSFSKRERDSGCAHTRGHACECSSLSMFLARKHARCCYILFHKNVYISGRSKINTF